MSPKGVERLGAMIEHRDGGHGTVRRKQTENLSGRGGEVGGVEARVGLVVGLQDQYLAGTRARSTRWRAAYDEAVDTVQGLVARQAGRRRVTVVVL